MMPVTTTQPPPRRIEYRPTPAMSLRLVELAPIWQVSTHEVARRLAALALVGLGVEHYDEIEQLAGQVPRAFEGAASLIAQRKYQSENNNADQSENNNAET